jgi:hypothetical protein
MDAARVMPGNKERLRALTKRPAPKAMWTHSLIHHESLATEELCPELSEVMETVIETINT